MFLKYIMYICYKLAYMNDTDLLDKFYKEEYEKEILFRNSISYKIHIVLICIYLFNNDLNFIKLDEPYRSYKKERLLKWFSVSEEYILDFNSDVELARIKLSNNFEIYKQIQQVFAYCGMENSDSVIFNKFVFKNDYENLLKYNI